jgi:hypothetical protein
VLLQDKPFPVLKFDYPVPEFVNLLTLIRRRASFSLNPRPLIDERGLQFTYLGLLVLFIFDELILRHGLVDFDAFERLLEFYLLFLLCSETGLQETDFVFQLFVNLMDGGKSILILQGIHVRQGVSECGDGLIEDSDIGLVLLALLGQLVEYALLFTMR